MKNFNKPLCSLLFLSATPIFAQNLASGTSSRATTLGVGNLAVLNDAKSGTLLNASNGVHDKMDTGLQLTHCNAKTKFTTKDKSSESDKQTCLDAKVHFMMPVGKIANAKNTSGFGVVIENNSTKTKADYSDSEDKSMQYSAIGTVGLGMFDIGLKYTQLMTDEIKNGAKSTDNKMTAKDSYGIATLSLGINVNDDLRIAVAASPETLHTYEQKQGQGKYKSVTGSAPTFAVSGAYKMQNILLTVGIERETAKVYKYKDENNLETKETQDGYTKSTVSGEIDLEVAKPRAGIMYIVSKENSAYGLSAGVDVPVGPVIATADLHYANSKADSEFMKTEFSGTSLSLGAKTTF